MARMFLLYPHRLTYPQEMEAEGRLGVKEFVSLPPDLLALWEATTVPSVPVCEYVSPILDWLAKNAQKEDYLFVHGELGFVFEVVTWGKQKGYRPIYSAAERKSVEDRFPDGDIINTSIYRHICFRLY